MRATIFGVMVCILDRLLRRESSVSALARVLTGRDLNADGGQKPNAYIVSFEVSSPLQLSVNLTHIQTHIDLSR